MTDLSDYEIDKSALYIGSSIQEIDAGSDAPMLAAIVDKLKDLDTSRISRDDGIVMRKAILALLTAVSNLESRINALEEAKGRSHDDDH
jgi:hypothetical protein